MKQIEVLFEELHNGMIKVVEINNVAKFDDIPFAEYRMGYPAMGLTRDGHFCIYKNEHERETYGILNLTYLSQITKNDFNELIKTMKMCGENYAKAKKNAEERNKRVIKSIKI
jgi:hypothetical protein